MFDKIEIGVEYSFKEEFCKQILEERVNVYERQRKSFLQWLEEFFDYELIKSRPLKIIIYKIKKEYEYFPKYDISKRLEIRKERENMIKDYIINVIFKEDFYAEIYLSYAKIARDMQKRRLILDINWRTLAYNYVKPVLNGIAEKIPPKDYVWKDNYKPLERKEVEAWYVVLKRYFDKQETMENILAWEELIQANDEADYTNMQKVINKQKRQYYRKAQREFEAEHGDFPIKAYKWKLNDESLRKLGLKINAF